MCGRNSNEYYRGLVEKTSMILCSACARFASKKTKIMQQSISKKKQKSQTYNTKAPQRASIVQLIVPDYAKKIKQAREKQNLKQEELAGQLAIKTSLLHSFEASKKSPAMDLARKLEKKLHITLIMQYEEDKKNISIKGKSSGPLTLGDLIKKRTK